MKNIFSFILMLFVVIGIFEVETVKVFAVDDIVVEVENFATDEDTDVDGKKWAISKEEMFMYYDFSKDGKIDIIDLIVCKFESMNATSEKDVANIEHYLLTDEIPEIMVEEFDLHSFKTIDEFYEFTKGICCAWRVSETLRGSGIWQHEIRFIGYGSLNSIIFEESDIVALEHDVTEIAIPNGGGYTFIGIGWNEEGVLKVDDSGWDMVSHFH